MKRNYESAGTQKAIDFIFKTVEIKKPDLLSLPREMADTVERYVPVFIHTGAFPEELRSPQARKLFVEELCTRYRCEKGVVLKVGKIFGKKNFQPWVKQAVDSGKLTFPGYARYRKMLMEGGKFSDESLAAIDQSSLDVLDHMGNPKQAGSYKTYGLMMGDVQSGKTATFTGVCHRAVDAGYRFILVLTGTKSTLRSQTQSRLDHDLIRLQTKKSGNKSPLPRNEYSWHSLTTVKSDFSASKIGTAISVDKINQVTIAVTQKNTRILQNILKCFDKNRGVGVSKLPFLLIDDEADSASVNVNKADEAATAINNKIREILNKFEKAAYLAVTATPFANVFIDPQLDPKSGMLQQDILPDLFPRNYIYPIPTPKGYIGVDRLFGELGEEERDSYKYRCLISMSDEDPEESGQVFPTKIKSKDKIKELPATLQKAVLYFLCVCTMKDIRDYEASNSSMLVHIAKYRRAQSDLRKLIEELVEKVTELQNVEGCRMTQSLRENPLYSELEDIWNNGLGEEKWYEDTSHGRRPHTLHQLTGFDWAKVWNSHFARGLEGVTVVEANMNSRIRDFSEFYKTHKAKLIVVGGDALSRGLTLEGLSVSYFSRHSFAYDTLLQMGRWFGFRERMSNYMKIWISEEMIRAYGIIAEALVEFKENVETMRQLRREPEEFGLKIRRAPDTVKLMVTAANKRRTAKSIRLDVNITGKAFQSATFPKNVQDIDYNVELVSHFLRELGPRSECSSTECSRDLVWNNVSAQRIAEVIKAMKVPRWTDDIDNLATAGKIESRGEQWSVRVICGVEGTGKQYEDVFSLGPNNKVVCATRTMIEKNSWIQQRKSGVLVRRDFARHWDERRFQQVKEAELAAGNDGELLLTPGLVLRQRDERPQLLIYPVRTIHWSDAEKKAISAGVPFEYDKPMVVLVFGIPIDPNDKRNEISVTYEVNKVWQMMRADGCSFGD